MAVKLNPPQREAVSYVATPLLVLAGAGSGKTGVITHKIAHLIREVGYKPTQIAAVTFTNKAAMEMRDRVRKILPGGESRGLQISTFHTLGLNILRKELKAIGLKSNFSLLDSTDSFGVLADVMRQFTGADTDRVKQAQWQISKWKNDGLDPAQAQSYAEDEIQLVQAESYARYERQIHAYNAVDFDDLIVKPVKIFREHAEVLERWQNKLRYVLVDEYQDTNEVQYQLVKQLVGPRQALTVVGDDDQSIYTWRGARPDNLRKLGEDFPRLKVIKLEQNYRSAGNILSAANGLIANNAHLFEKRLWSEMGPGDSIRVVPCRDEIHEAERVVSEIISHRYRTNSSYTDYAILYRGNHQSRLFEKALREQRVPYVLSGGTSFFDRAEVKDLMAYLRLMANVDDDSAFLRIINTPRREIGAQTLEQLGEYAKQRNCSLLVACHEMGLQEFVSARTLPRLREFALWVSRMSERMARGDVLSAVRDMLHDIDYQVWLTEQSKDEKAAEKRWANVMELVGWLEKLCEPTEQNKDLQDAVSHMSLMSILERQDAKENEDSLSLMTLHAAKGLEFPHVFIIGMEEEILPHRTSIDEGNIEEERRLAYVGITRAQRTLTLSFASKRKRFGETITCEPSRFLEELPEAVVKWETARNNGPRSEESKQHGQAQLAHLRGLLGALAK
ncbi:MAG: DNA helicase Rep [Gammaproteobacteria bacterium]|nr:DNA helicase Rep [Gammaproteobacteria bacterium]MDH5693363.1 DNA helicase Rep [Gammaproteobacteria bacterium]